MGSLFKKKKPKPPPRKDPRIEEEKRKAMLAETRRRGASGAILTGPSGLSGEPLIGKATLLGGR